MAKEHENDDDLNDLDLTEEGDQEEFDEDLFDEDFLSEEIEEPLEAEADTEEETPSDEKAAIPPEEKAADETKLVSPDEIPLQLVVEIGEIKMTIEQLMKLEPGNMLDIDILPEHGVNLTIQGKHVGKGELIRIGEAIGVRVLQLGQE